MLFGGSVHGKQQIPLTADLHKLKVEVLVGAACIRHVTGDDKVVVDAHIQRPLQLGQILFIEPVGIIDVVVIDRPPIVVVPVVELLDRLLNGEQTVVIIPHEGDRLRQEDLVHAADIVVFKIREVALDELIHLRVSGRTVAAAVRGKEADQDRRDHDQCGKAAQQTDEQLFRLVLGADLRRGDRTAGRGRIPVGLALWRFGYARAADGAKTRTGVQAAAAMRADARNKGSGRVLPGRHELRRVGPLGNGRAAVGAKTHTVFKRSAALRARARSIGGILRGIARRLLRRPAGLL